MKIKFSKTAYKVKPVNWGSLIDDQMKESEAIEVNIRQLGACIKNGYCFMGANFKDGKGITKDLIENFSIIPLDIDSDKNETPIKMHEMIFKIEEKFNIVPTLAYRTFSDINETRFRLIYEFENPVTEQEYSLLYKGFIHAFEEFLDKKTCNPTRLWCGTNKPVLHIKVNKIITDEVKEKILAEIPKTQPKTYTAKKKTKPIEFDDDFINKVYIKSEFKNEICDIICNSIDVEQFIIDNFGGTFKRSHSRSTGSCSIHGGDNPTALSIYRDSNTYSCYTRCGTGNVLTLAYKHYNTDDFSSVVLKLINDYGLEIPKEAIGIRW